MVAPSSNPLDQVLDPLIDCFTPESAQRLIALRLDSRTQARIDELARKANEGLLTPTEESDYLEYIEAMDLIAILQSKARHALSRTG
jgi:hypothetical protein